MRHTVTLLVFATALGMLNSIADLSRVSGGENTDFAHLERRIAAAKEVNAYLQVKKGGDAYFLFDPNTVNLLSFGFFVERDSGTISLRSASPTVTLRERELYSLKSDGSDFAVLMQDNKIAVINFTTDQSGVIVLDRRGGE